jgi:uncharacterized membrane protein
MTILTIMTIILTIAFLFVFIFVILPTMGGDDDSYHNYRGDE